MRIDSTGRALAAPAAGAARRTGGGFSVPTGGEPARAGGLSAPSQVASLGMILSLQEVAEDDGRRRRGARRGESLLDRLEELKLGLLSGGIDRSAIGGLMTLLADRPATDDPRLEAVLDEIELRAHVELAKLGHYLP